jgi:hypothetical protein
MDDAQALYYYVNVHATANLILHVLCHPVPFRSLSMECAVEKMAHSPYGTVTEWSIQTFICFSEQER